MISVQGLVHRYGDSAVLRLAEWTVGAGERWLVLGPSGSGKSNLLHILAGLASPSEGEVSIYQRKISAYRGRELDRWRRARVGIVLQALHLVSHLSVRANLRLAQCVAHLA